MTRYHSGRKPTLKPQGEWLRLSHLLTLEIDEIADRDDLLVKIDPDAGYDDAAYHNGELQRDHNGQPLGQQHPGITFLHDAIIEINASYIPDDVLPVSMRPEFRKDRERYPLIWGILTHEGAHAHYSHWVETADEMKLTGEPALHLGAAILLEETRIEKKQIDFRPQDQIWLQAWGTHSAAVDFTAALQQYQEEHPGEPLPKHVIGRAAALVLARVDAGSVTPDDNTRLVQQLVDDIFGEDAQELQRIWLQAQNTGDYDTGKMLDLGRRWYEITGDSGAENHIVIIIDDDDDSPLGQALRDIARDSLREANGEAERERRENRHNKIIRGKQQEGAATQEARKIAQNVFGAGQGDCKSNPVTGYRDPTPQEMSLARLTKRRLLAAYVPERAVTKVTRPLPPGRLSTRVAQQLDAQHRTGSLPTAEPFTYKDRQHVTTPPLKVGIIQDVSSSQSGAAAAAASGAWSLAKATRMITDAQVAMVSFGDSVQPIINPRKKLGGVPILKTPYGTSHFVETLKAVEGQLDLTRPGAARLVVVLTDGEFDRYDLNHRDPALKRLTDHGVKILWVVTDGDYDGYLPGRNPGVHVFREAAGNYGVIPKMICGEAVYALKK